MRLTRKEYREIRLKQYRNYENLSIPRDQLDKVIYWILFYALWHFLYFCIRVYVSWVLLLLLSKERKILVKMRWICYLDSRIVHGLPGYCSFNFLLFLSIELVIYTSSRPFRNLSWFYFCLLFNSGSFLYSWKRVMDLLLEVLLEVP